MSIKHWTGFIALTLIWGASFLWIKLAVRESGPFTIVTLRLLMAVVVLLVIVLIRRTPLPRGRRVWGAFVILE